MQMTDRRILLQTMERPEFANYLQVADIDDNDQDILVTMKDAEI